MLAYGDEGGDCTAAGMAALLLCPCQIDEPLMMPAYRVIAI